MSLSDIGFTTDPLVRGEGHGSGEQPLRAKNRGQTDWRQVTGQRVWPIASKVSLRILACHGIAKVENLKIATQREEGLVAAMSIDPVNDTNSHHWHLPRS